MHEEMWAANYHALNPPEDDSVASSSEPDALGEALMSAASSNRVEAVEDLLLAGADPNYLDRSSMGALHFAVHNAKYEVIPVLLKAGADANRRGSALEGTGEFLTPLQMTIVSATVYHDDRDEWFDGTRTGGIVPGVRPKIVEALIAAGANPNARFGDRPYSLFSFALARRSRGCVLALLRGGAAIIPSHLPPASFRLRNRDAFALVDAVKKAGDFKRYARAHQRRYGSILDKCFGDVTIPRDVQAIIALFLAPWGGS